MLKVLSIASAELGYREKYSNSQLDDKLANAGYNNYTKYARDVDKTDMNNGAKNGYAWCAVFVEWCMMQAYGVANAKKLLCLPNKSLGAGVNYLKDYFKAKKQLYTTPQVGDVVFFGVQHTGLVSAVNGSKITTIEGNTSDASGVVGNGGMVCLKSYTVNSSMTFGRPKYSIVNENPVEANTKPAVTVSVTLPQLSIGDKCSQVRTLQMLLNCYGCNCGIADSDFGMNTETAVKMFQTSRKLSADGVCGKNTWDKLLNG